MDFNRLKTLNSGESAKLNKVTQSLDKKKNRLEKEIIDIQNARRTLEAKKRSIVLASQTKQNEAAKKGTESLSNQDMAVLANETTVGWEANDSQDIKDIDDPTQVIKETETNIPDRPRKSLTSGQKSSFSRNSSVPNKHSCTLNEDEQAVSSNHRPLVKSLSSGLKSFSKYFGVPNKHTGTLNEEDGAGLPNHRISKAGIYSQAVAPNYSDTQLPNIGTTKSQRRVSLPDSYRITPARPQRSSKKLLNTLETDMSKHGSPRALSKEDLQLPGVTRIKPLKTSYSDLMTNDQQRISNRQELEVETSARFSRHLSIDYNNNLQLPVPEITCNHFDGESREITLQSAFKRKKALSLVELERSSKSSEELDQILVGRFKRIGEGSIGEMFLRSRQAQSYEYIVRKKGIEFMLL